MNVDPSLLSYSEGSDTEIRLIDPFLDLVATGIQRLNVDLGAEALLAFWFSVPEGSVVGRPSWGHPFKSRLFNMVSDNEIVVYEMLAIQKLRNDIPQVKITGIRGELVESDLLLLTVYYPKGRGVESYSGKVSL